VNNNTFNFGGKMKKSLITLLFLALAGCSKGNGPNMCTTSNLSDPFSGNKVQLNTMGLRALTNEQGLATSVMDLKNEATTSPQTIPAGTELVAVMKDSCLNRAPTPSGVTSVPWKAPKDMTLAELKQMVQADSCFVGISDKITLVPHGDFTDPKVVQQTQLQAIEQGAGDNLFLDPAKGITKDVVIAIIDSGVDIDHEDLKDNLWVNTKEIPGNGVDDDHNGYIDDVNGWNFADNNNNPRPQTSGAYHGTHVAGLAAARGGNGIGGAGSMGQHVKIMALNVFGSSDGASNADIDNAIRYAADNGADVINMSLGGAGRASDMEQAIQYALSKNVTIIVAAGNDNSELTAGNFETPASFSGLYTGVLAIGSVDTYTLARSYFSNYGPSYVKLAAPGSDSQSGSGLLSTLPGNNYGRLQGTSMASPVAAGGAGLVVGLLKSRGYKSTPAMVEDAMLASGKVVAGLSDSFKDGKVMNLNSMAKYLDGKYPKAGNNLSGNGSGGTGNLGSNGGISGGPGNNSDTCAL
jgi:hypothetical protein